MDVAVIVAVPAADAVKSPALLMLPMVAGLTDQETVWLGLLVPWTVGLHWSVAPTSTLADAQVTLTEVTVD